MQFPRTSLEQWRVLQAIVECGGFAQAATALNRSQSAISYAVARLQEQLGVALLVPEGRRMKLTEAGEALLRDARPLLDAAFRLERRARSLQEGWEPEVRLAVDGLCPTAPLWKPWRNSPRAVRSPECSCTRKFCRGRRKRCYGARSISRW
ncbi:MAG: LysR family transcriptional regulator [Comamonadaceae bacterium]|nr:LysR family transcriptional regulator [Comamonadaceae bacterium]